MTNAELVERVTNLLEEAFSALDENGPKRFEELAEAIAYLTAVQDHIKFLLSELSGSLYESMPEQELTNEFGTFVKQSGSKRTSWDKERLVALLGSRSADDLDEDAPRAVVAEHAANEILRCAGIGYFKVTELRKRHINSDDYCEKTEGSPRVQFTRAS